jgi:HD-GYP domain-containing protein (c-di-GMP phosphodiesterase class II)
LPDQLDEGQARPAEIAAEVRSRGAPLLEALDERFSTAVDRAEVAAVLAGALAIYFDPEEQEAVRETARLQEIGKLYVPAEVLTRPLAELGKAEREQLASHYEHGRDLARGAGVPEQACSWILHARERWDGSGPTGLRAREIPLASRIIAATREYLDAPMQPGADSSDPRQAALRRLEEVSGSTLDPEIAARAITLASVGDG